MQKQDQKEASKHIEDHHNDFRAIIKKYNLAPHAEEIAAFLEPGNFFIIFRQYLTLLCASVIFLASLFLIIRIYFHLMWVLDASDVDGGRQYFGAQEFCKKFKMTEDDGLTFLSFIDISIRFKARNYYFLICIHKYARLLNSYFAIIFVNCFVEIIQLRRPTLKLELKTLLLLQDNSIS